MDRYFLPVPNGENIAVEVHSSSRNLELIRCTETGFVPYFYTLGGREQLYQTITLVVIVLFIDFLERRRPGHAVDRRRQLPLNILALLVVIVAGETSKVLLTSSYRHDSRADGTTT